MAVKLSLNGDDWEIKGFVGEAWRGAEDPKRNETREWKTGTVPGTVYSDLWAHGEIPDPYYERNSLATEWVPARHWVYRKRFKVTDDFLETPVRLCFDGIDYAGRVFLNGVELGWHEGMYVPVAYEIGALLRFPEENVLVIVLDPAPNEESQVGHTSHVRTHKSRMTYWWDFCPRMIHVGIWDSVWLEATGSVRIDDVHVMTTQLDKHPTEAEALSAEVMVNAAFSSLQTGSMVTRVAVSYDGKVVATSHQTCSVHAGENTVSHTLTLPNPALWWPNGLGEANQYQVMFEVEGQGGATDTRTIGFGIRSVELVSNEDAPSDALPYTFVVNGVRTYIKGWNWVPLDVMYGKQQPEKLRHLLMLAKKADVNLLRVWGGGLIEREDFYALCDEFGIMVWQEWIQSSSGIENKPSEAPSFIEMMVEQAKAIVPGRRNHPSLVLWCGGNELQDLDGKPLDDSEPVLSALRQVVEQLHPGALWLPTSPTGPFFMNSLKNIELDPNGLHDVHGPWEHQGLTEQYRLYNAGTSLFHSEFGAEGIANLRTIHETISVSRQWPATRDNPVWNHRGSWWINEPLVQACFGGRIQNIETLVKASQFLQSEGLRYAVESNRRRAFHNSGTIPWQLNESYPNAYCTASVDYYGRPKLAYYAVAKAYQPVSITASFNTQAWDGHAEFESQIHVSNSLGHPIEGVVVATIVGLSGKAFSRMQCSKEIPSHDVPASPLVLTMPFDELDEEIFFLDLRFENGVLEPAMNRYLFTRKADLACLFEVPNTTLLVSYEQRTKGSVVSVKNEGNVAALGVRFDDTLPLRTKQYVYFSDSGFDLLPGEVREICISSSQESAKEEIKVGAWNADEQTISVPLFRVG